MMRNPNTLLNFFVGNKHNHIFFNGTWKRVDLPITRTLVMKHLKHEIAIGSYPIYYKKNIPYCRWLCIDIDSHARIPHETRKEIRAEYDDKTAKRILKKLENEYKKRVDYELKAKQKRFTVRLFNGLSGFFNIDPWKHCFVEDSGGGYHLWLFLADDTLLEDLGKLVYVIKERINNMYRDWVGDEELPEFYPKQYTVDHLGQGLGNAVRLPFGYNFNKQHASKIVRGWFDSDITHKLDIRPLVKNVNVDVSTLNKVSNRRIRAEVFKAQELPSSLDFWMELPIRECFKWVIDGKTQCRDSHGHDMRIALVHELTYFKMPFHMILECFKQQDDFDMVESADQIESVIRKGDWRWSCAKINLLGYCHNCGEYGKRKI